MAENTILVLESRRAAYFERLQTIYTSSKNLSDQEEIEQFLARVETLPEIRESYLSTVETINTLHLELSPGKYKPDHKSWLAFEELYCRIQRVIKNINRESEIKREESIVDTRVSKPRLPPIEIPTFDGNPFNWPLFYASFKTTIHENPALSDSERLHYLLSKLVNKARFAIAGLTPNASNYNIIYNNLVEKFENKRFQATTYLDNIFDLKSISNATANNLENFIDRFASSVAALKNLNLSDMTDFILLYIALNKLDAETVRAFETESKGVQFPTLKNLELFLRDQINILNRTSSGKLHLSQINAPHRRGPAGPHATHKKGSAEPPRFTHTYISISNNDRSNNDIAKCSFCKESAIHNNLYKCTGYSQMTPQERLNVIRKIRGCVNCLSIRHRTRDCKSLTTCKKCGLRHHTMLHLERSIAVEPHPSSASSSDESRVPAPENNSANRNDKAVSIASAPAMSGIALNSITSHLVNYPLNEGRPGDSDVLKITSASTSTVLLGTARVVIKDCNGVDHLVRCLLDSASQSNFITRACCLRLGLNNFASTNSVVTGIGGSLKAVRQTTRIQFASRFDNYIKYDLDVLVVDKITGCLPTTHVDASALSSFANLRLADDTYTQPGEIDMLIGASLFAHLILPLKVTNSSGTTQALETTIGYIVVGSAPSLNINAAYSAPIMSVSCCSVLSSSLDNLVKKFWELEELPVLPAVSPDDRACEEIYQRTTSRNPTDGRYTVALPFKENPARLGNSFESAKKRFLCLERKLEAAPHYRRAYDNVILDYIAKEFISPVLLEDEEFGEVPSYFIGHHGIFREEKSTPLRIVLDASGKTTSAVSLNDLLHNGENLLGNLFNIIINFRLFPVALAADVRHMFLCISMRACDRQFQRILYRFNPQDPLTAYQFNRVCFGLKSSPFLALRTIKQLMSDEGNNFRRAVSALSSSLYMDDFVHSVESEDDSIALSQEVIALLKTGQFDMVKWNSNSTALMETIPESHRLSSAIEFDKTELHKILGLSWSPSADLFRFKVLPLVKTCTKRTILSCVARLWDLMGFIGPVILFAKLLIRELWTLKRNWDDVPPDSIVSTWDKYYSELHLLSQISIPRWVGISIASTVTIVGFGDASEKAYGAVVYFHVNNDNNNKMHLICSKSKVAPTKSVSLARLELCAALLLSKLIRTVYEAVSNRITINNIYAFSDSTVTLCWLYSSPHRWSTFVANRVSKIQSNVSPNRFFHVPGADNPADCLSRGLTPAQLLNHPLWFHGPPWAHLTPTLWPVTVFEPSVVSKPPEEKVVNMVQVQEINRLGLELICLADRVSSWSKLLCIVVYMFRFLKILPRRRYIVASDLSFAEIRIIQELQKFHFHREINNLKENKCCTISVQRLKPFMHEGVIRVGGRLERADLPFENRHPLLLPRREHIVTLIINYFHKVYCHAGPDLLVSILRQKYWILSARNIIRNVIFKCNTCFRLRPKPTFPEMSDLKSCRVNPAFKPFTHTGSDFTGPLRVTAIKGRGVRARKAYVCIFVCLTTRAVHIELASDLSTECFLSALKRFLSRRGPIAHIYTDNGSNYVGAKRYLGELYSVLKSPQFNSQLSEMLAENRIEWHFNPPSAPHFGGNWEVNIKSMKAHLFRVIGEQVLTYEEMTTVLTQVEAVMNSRPLCRTLSSDPSEPLALTPAHFLTYSPLKYLPAPPLVEERTDLLTRFSLLDKLVQSFWKRWKREYLHNLQTRTKWNKPATPISVGTVVVIVNDNTPPLQWPLAIVKEVFPGKDGIVRVARVQTTSGTYIRPMVKLCPLPSQ